MSLSSYLASKYLTASNPEKTSKKRKRKQGTSSGLIIADDDALGWGASTSADGDEDGQPLTVNSGSAEFRKAKKNAWKTVGVPALQPTSNGDDEAAEKIIRDAAAENAAALHADEEPVVEDDGVVKMGDGTHAGLQSASAVAEQFARRKREEAAAWEAEEKAAGRGKKGKGKDAGEETVYRDATGRRIDISMRRQEARRELDEKARKEAEEKEAQKGDVQRREQEKRRADLDEARFMPVARGVDDKEMNDDLREVERWNDPAAQFLTKKEKTRTGGGGGSAKKVYSGAAAPNRYGIRPGHRWDGVDRGNGWEGERFKAINRRARNKDLGFAWEMDT
ncbi:putative pre-mRNA-splicing factor cwc26 [Coleophoma cylindrospora]|uniref:Putative pre-mRNA-splicing factor cwc26 n=1 Tax=Coleophoma cylindrospora TaxID=1849047 RepID=A0A3D8RTB8_9HELO|nr:putative pre-mRNA-splicing factor cwc26 [Coleophoma cylindrospora]